MLSPPAIELFVPPTVLAAYAFSTRSPSSRLFTPPGTTASSKSQIVIPSAVRRSVGIKQGSVFALSSRRYCYRCRRHMWSCSLMRTVCLTWPCRTRRRATPRVSEHYRRTRSHHYFFRIAACLLDQADMALATCAHENIRGD